MFEGDDLSVQNHVAPKIAARARRFRKLIGDPPEIARENFDSIAIHVKLGANAIELVFDINRPASLALGSRCGKAVSRLLLPSVLGWRACT